VGDLVTGEAMRPDPKPVKRAKAKPTGLKRKRWGVQRKAGGTKHSRRWRDWGRMAWLHSLRVCFVREFVRQRFNGPLDEMPRAIALRLAGTGLMGDCYGAFQCSHLFGRYRDPHDAKTVLACRRHHEDIDRTRAWFLALTKPERLWLKTDLAARATAGWDQVPPSEQARWREIGLARLGRDEQVAA
jgi:hypothetical protein